MGARGERKARRGGYAPSRANRHADGRWTMKQKDIPVYIDPDDFEALTTAKYPCSTQYTVYKALTARYYLTVEALQNFNIDIDGGYAPEAQTMQFIEEVTDDLYGVMARLAPYNYQYNCYLVAQSRSLQFRDRYAARKQFEKALIYQAQYKAINIDVRNLNGIDLESNNNVYYKQLRKEFRHISPKSLDILQSLGLFFNGDIPGKRLIDYEGGM
jgi:hypothetical protein